MNNENDPLIDNLREDANRSRPAFSVDLHSRVLRQINAERTAARPAMPRNWRWSIHHPFLGLAIAAALLVVATVSWVILKRSHDTDPQRIVRTVPTPDSPTSVSPPTALLASSGVKLAINFDELTSVRLSPIRLKVGPAVRLQFGRERIKHQRASTLGTQIAAAIHKPVGEIEHALVDLLAGKNSRL